MGIYKIIFPAALAALIDVDKNLFFS